MTDAEAAELKEATHKVYHELYGIWADSIAKYKAGTNICEMLARATTLVRDAALIIDAPYLNQVHCITFNRQVHACNFKGAPLCGAPDDMMASHVPSVQVPTCPDCIAVLKSASELGAKIK